MPFNIYNFLIANMLANTVFEERNVPNPEESKRLALTASFLSPAGGGGLGLTMLPMLFVQSAARKLADDAAADKAKSDAAAADKPPADDKGDTDPREDDPLDTEPGGEPEPDPGDVSEKPVVTRAEIAVITRRLAEFESYFAPYPNVVGRRLGDARKLLEPTFSVIGSDQNFRMSPVEIDDTPYVTDQKPNPTLFNNKALRGMTVVLYVRPDRTTGSQAEQAGAQPPAVGPGTAGVEQADPAQSTVRKTGKTGGT